MYNNFEIKIASISELEKIFDEKTKANPADAHLPFQKIRRMEDAKNKTKIFFFGFLNGELIAEANATISTMDVHTQNIDKVMGEKTAYLSAFLTKEKYRGQGYFSKLYAFMEKELAKRGFEYLTLGVEPEDEKNKAIYHKWGYTEHIYTGIEEFDGMRVNVEYYRKTL